MSSARIPYFQFYPSDFMHGVRGLKPNEVGIYAMLLCRIYENNGPIEVHISRLSTYCGVREKTFEKVLNRLVDLGKFTHENGLLSNDRANEEIAKRNSRLNGQKIAGQKSAEKRQQKQRQKSTDVEPTFNHTDTDTDINTTPLNPPLGESDFSQKKETEKPKRSKLAKRPECVDESLWRDFKTHRGSNKLTETALKGFEREAAKANITLSQAIQTSIERGWRGFNADWLKRNDLRSRQAESKPSPAMIDCNGVLLSEWEIKTAIKTWESGGRWSLIGRPPGDPGCCIPPDVLQRYAA